MTNFIFTLVDWILYALKAVEVVNTLLALFITMHDICTVRGLITGLYIRLYTLPNTQSFQWPSEHSGPAS